MDLSISADVEPGVALRRSGSASSAVQLVEFRRQGLVELGEEVAVAVKGDGDGRVAEAFLDGFGVCAEGDAECGAGVAEVVEAHLGG